MILASLPLGEIKRYDPKTGDTDIEGSCKVK